MNSSINSNWDGSPLRLAQNASATMPQTPNGSTVLAWQNMAAINNDGTLSLTSGGEPPQILKAPAMATQPSFIARNWQSNALMLANVSVAPAPIQIQMLGPGIPGVPPARLQTGTPLQLTSGQTAQGSTQPGGMQFVFTAPSADLTTVVVLGGPPDSGGNNAYVFGLNFPGSTPPPGYTKVTPGHNLAYQFNWGVSTAFVANLSAQSARPLEVLLRLL